jgi:CSLREA domain-containing protein
MRVRTLRGILLLVAVSAALASPLAPPDAHGATITVNSSDDADDGTCDATHCSLREAILLANASGGSDTIEFDTGGPPVIQPLTQLPTITGDLILNGLVDEVPPFARLDGTLSTGAHGLHVDASTLQIDHLIIGGFDGDGIHGTASLSVTASIIGEQGGVPGNGGDGIHLVEGTPIIGGAVGVSPNTIVGNGGWGIRVDAWPAFGQIQGNWIGTDGVLAQPNALGGIYAGPGSASFGSIGGIAPDEANVVSGNGGPGIQIHTSGLLAEGNLVGTDFQGAVGDPSLGNASHGIHVVAGAVGVTLFANRAAQNGGDAFRIEGDGATLNSNHAGVATCNPCFPTFSGVGNAGHGVYINADGVDLNYNLMHSSGGDGIFVDSGASDVSLNTRNVVFRNSGLGIDLAPDGVTPNDPLDADTGANSLQNFPVFGRMNVVHPWLNGGIVGPPGATITIDFADTGFSGCDVSGHGEYPSPMSEFTIPVGFPVTVTTNTLGYAHFQTRQDYQFGLVAIATRYTGGGGETSEVSRCLTVNSDEDADTVVDGLDNCVVHANASQVNSDPDLIDLPGKPYDDNTWPNSDILGDECDDDDDNDGLLDVDEASGTQCGGIVTDPLVRDTDGDLSLDGGECAAGTDPTDIASRPSVAACGGSADTDADGVQDFRERCYYATSITTSNTDGDACGDRKEIMSVNASQAVDVIDLQQVAAETGIYALPGMPVQVNFDVTKNARIDVIDLQQIAAAAGNCP